MKQAVLSLVLLTIFPAIVSAQTQSRQRLSPEQSTTNESDAVRTRVVGPKVSNHAASQKARTSEAADNGSTPRSSTFTWGNIPIPEQPSRAATPSNSSSVAAAEPPAPKLVQPTVLATNGTPNVVNSRVVSSPRPPVSPALYIVGAGDVLDISLPNTPARESTLFTVLKNGTIEYPLLNGPLAVAGMTAEQISGALAAQIKVIKTPKVNVSVRDYASHSVVVSGLVDNAGKKVLRRESVPLYAILADAAIRAEATTATIIHNGKEGTPLSLKDESAMSAPIFSGDAIRISGGNSLPGQYVYIGGDVAVPGEKTLRPGMTLTQVLIAAGADLSSKQIAKIARRNPNGLLSTVEYDINSIARGKTADPLIVAGDRVEVKPAR